PGRPLAWAPTPEEGGRIIARRARPGDVLLTIGAGDVDRAVAAILEELA
ncbi:MAG: UDP-N-acetylmuramate--L-alanine ligase, partial [Chloroflexota bacterium]